VYNLGYRTAGAIGSPTGINSVIRWGSDGNVGIGTTTPASKLDVAITSGYDVARLTSTDSAQGPALGLYTNEGSVGFIQAGGSDFSSWGGASSMSIVSLKSGGMYFNTSGGGNFRFMTGNVSIGDTTATSMFNVGTANQFQVTSTGVSSAGAGSTDLNGSGVPEVHCLVDGSGCPPVTQTIPASTVSGLSVDVPTGALALVTNGTTATDCTIGGGTIDVLCRFSGSAWVAYSTFVNASYVPTNHFTSNSFGVCYTNSTGLLIHLHITTISSPADTTTLFEGSCPTPSTVAAAQSQVGGSGELSGDIPNGASYYVTNDGSGTLVTWLEVY
jgi:hypothetical protein